MRQASLSTTPTRGRCQLQPARPRASPRSATTAPPRHRAGARVTVKKKKAVGIEGAVVLYSPKKIPVLFLFLSAVVPRWKRLVLFF